MQNLERREKTEKFLLFPQVSAALTTQGLGDKDMYKYIQRSKSQWTWNLIIMKKSYPIPIELTAVIVQNSIHSL